MRWPRILEKNLNYYCSLRGYKIIKVVKNLKLSKKYDFFAKIFFQITTAFLVSMSFQNKFEKSFKS